MINLFQKKLMCAQLNQSFIMTMILLLDLRSRENWNLAEEILMNEEYSGIAKSFIHKVLCTSEIIQSTMHLPLVKLLLRK